MAEYPLPITSTIRNELILVHRWMGNFRPGKVSQSDGHEGLLLGQRRHWPISGRSAASTCITEEGRLPPVRSAGTDIERLSGSLLFG